MKPLAGKVHALFGPGGNIAVLVTDDGMLMVDALFAQDVPNIEGKLGELGRSQVLRFLVNTHWHGDHTGGNDHFGKGTTVVAHDNVRARLEAREGVEGRTREGAPASALPTVTYQDGMRLFVGEESIRLRHFAEGHTDGDGVSSSRPPGLPTWGISTSTGAFRSSTAPAVARSTATSPRSASWWRSSTRTGRSCPGTVPWPVTTTSWPITTC